VATTFTNCTCILINLIKQLHMTDYAGSRPFRRAGAETWFPGDTRSVGGRRGPSYIHFLQIHFLLMAI